MKYLDPEERYNKTEEVDTSPSIIREIVKARVSGRCVVMNLPSSLRDPLGMWPGCKLMVTLDQENKRLIITKE